MLAFPVILSFVFSLYQYTEAWSLIFKDLSALNPSIASSATDWKGAPS